MSTFVPETGDPEVNFTIHGCVALSNVEASDCGGTAALEVPTVTQLSAARVGKKLAKRLLIPPAVDPVA
jgi:hypothetical protein